MPDWIDWPHFLIFAAIMIKALNLVTKHFRDHRGLVRACLFVIDLLDVVKTSHGGTHGGIPGSPPPTRKESK